MQHKQTLIEPEIMNPDAEITSTLLAVAARCDVVIDAQIALDQHKQAILELEYTVTANILEIGKHLCAIRDVLLHNKMGGFETWVEEHIGFSRQTAYNYLNTFERFGNCQTVLQLGLPRRALYALASENTPEEARTKALARAEAGEQLTFRQVDALIRECKYRTSHTRIGQTRSRISTSKSKSTNDAKQPVAKMICAFCTISHIPVYIAGPGSSIGICMGCAQRALESLKNRTDSRTSQKETT